MSDQLTQCPHCQTSFRVTPGQLKSAGGLVRCGSCLGLFSAAINFIRVKPDENDDESSSHDVDDMDSSDDILLGDLDLESLTALDEDTEDDFAATLDEEDAFEEAGEILLTDAVRVRPTQDDEYELYEEYEEAPDLLADLSTVPAAGTEADDAAAPEPFALTSDNAPEPVAAPIAPIEDELELDWLDGPSEEFKPRTILFDDDDDEDEDEVGADHADDVGDELEAEADDATDAFTTATDFADDYPDEALTDVREASLDRGGPELGELDADEFDTPELSELDLDELLPAHDSFGASDFEDEEEVDDSDDDQDDDDFDDEEEDAEAILEEYMEEIRLDAGERSPAVDDFTALTGQARTSASKEKPEWLQRRDPPPPDKAALHDYLATLEDEDDLEPLGADRLDDFDDEPVLLAEDRRSRSLLATTGLLLLSLLLIGTLLLQFVDQHLEALRQRNSFARFEPWFCAVLDCPPPAEPVTASSSLYSQELLIRSHPRLKGALELSFIFRNDADTAQPFPGLELSFKDPANTLLANRLLLPADYLPAELRPLTAMPAHSSVQVMLELVDPGAEAVNYTIAFRDL
jgi:predicted Zn finger-like uncharacterized protein